MVWDKPRIKVELKRLHRKGANLSYNALARRKQSLPLRYKKSLRGRACPQDLNGESLAALVILDKLPALPHPAPALKDGLNRGKYVDKSITVTHPPG